MNPHPRLPIVAKPASVGRLHPLANVAASATRKMAGTPAAPTNEFSVLITQPSILPARARVRNYGHIVTVRCADSANISALLWSRRLSSIWRLPDTRSPGGEIYYSTAVSAGCLSVQVNRLGTIRI